MDRIEDDELRRVYRAMPCELCSSRSEVSGHHIKTRGSGGHDIRENLVAVCFTCHHLIHAYGINKMILNKPKLELILRAKGWYCQTIGSKQNEVLKWFNDKVKS